MLKMCGARFLIDIFYLAYGEETESGNYTRLQDKYEIASFSRFYSRSFKDIS